MPPMHQAGGGGLARTASGRLVTPQHGPQLAQLARTNSENARLRAELGVPALPAGWEVKALRAGKVQLTDSYVLMKDGEAYLLGASITPLDTVSTHFVTDPIRTRKLLLNKKELAQINAAVTQKGQTCVCSALYWKGHLVKARIDLAQGKKLHDKRDTEKERDWQRQKARIVRDNVKQ